LGLPIESNFITECPYQSSCKHYTKKDGKCQALCCLKTTQVSKHLLTYERYM
jgi:hypothetical protein